MHEFSIMQSTLDIAFEHATNSKADKITSLHLRIGEFSGVIQEALEFAFEALTSGTIAEGATLEVEKVPICCYCDSCDKNFNPSGYSFECPDCKTPSASIIEGREMEITEIEVV